MAAGDVKSFERARFKAHLKQLTASGDISDAAFAEAVYEAVASHGLAESDLRDTLGLSSGALERWTMQKNLPQPMVRGKVLGMIADLL